MSKEKFNILESTCVPLPLENVDTDQIIPARFLSATTREGFGENLFRDWRFDKSGNRNMEFVLNNNNIQRKDPGRREEFWKRIKPRTCSMGNI